MVLIVQKYGGTSVSNVKNIINVAKKIAKAKNNGNDVVVIVSAMAGETDKLIDLAHKISKNPNSREYAMLITTGEQITTVLLTMTLQKMGLRAKSFLGFQIKILTDQSFTKAKIIKIETELLRKTLKEDTIIVIAGFQGIDNNNNITSLGRGGSDTSAVAVAAVLKASICEIYTDVNGIYTTDPNFYKDAKKINKISYDEMLEMASSGAKVIHPRSIELAKKYNVSIFIKSTFSNLEEKTLITKEESIMEKTVITSIVCDVNQIQIKFIKIPNKPQIIANLFTSFLDKNIELNMIRIENNYDISDYVDVIFTIIKSEIEKFKSILKTTSFQRIPYKNFKLDENIAIISIIGSSIKTNTQLISKIFCILAKQNINILMVSISDIKISYIIPIKFTRLAVKVLHEELLKL